MPLVDDLLAQAKLLANLETNRPKQSSLRRAVSTAYYALFHLLIDAAVKNIVRGGSNEMENQLRRGFDHRAMKEVCKSISSTTPLGPANHLLDGPISNDLKIVADVFDSMQTMRHLADYDLAKSFIRTQVVALIEETDSAFRAWRREQRSDNARVFLLSLLMHKRWNK
jgi:hypothetical protein